MGIDFHRSVILFARPSFIEGFARVLDLGATLNEYNTARTPELADRQALLNDWLAVGDDLYSSIEQLESENKDRLVSA